jgi:integration host factor subunit alpha
MALKKTDLVTSIIDNVHLKKRVRERQQYLFPELNYTFLKRRRAGKIIDSMLEIIKGTLERGEIVLISGFGKFNVKFKWARKGTNPKTGERIFLKSRRTVVFHCSDKLKERINKSEDRSQKTETRR